MDGFASVELRAAGIPQLTVTGISTAAPVPLLRGHALALAAMLAAAGLVALRPRPRSRKRP